MGRGGGGGGRGGGGGGGSGGPTSISTGITNATAARSLGTLSLPPELQRSSHANLGRQFLSRTQQELNAAPNDNARIRIARRAQRRLTSISNELAQDEFFRSRGQTARFTTAQDIRDSLGL